MRTIPKNIEPHLVPFNDFLKNEMSIETDIGFCFSEKCLQNILAF